MKAKPFITLTPISPEPVTEGDQVHLNKEWIRTIEQPIHKTSTRIDLMGGSRGSAMRGAELWVCESPEQIMKLMKEN